MRHGHHFPRRLIAARRPRKGGGGLRHIAHNKVRRSIALRQQLHHDVVHIRTASGGGGEILVHKQGDITTRARVVCQGHCDIAIGGVGGLHRVHRYKCRDVVDIRHHAHHKIGIVGGGIFTDSKGNLQRVERCDGIVNFRKDGIKIAIIGGKGLRTVEVEAVVAALGV